MLLANQWSLRPAGTQIELRDFPINVAVPPNSRFAAVLHSGYSANQVSIVDLLSGYAVSHASIEQSFYGLEFSTDGKRLFCSGAGDEVIHSFEFQNGNLGTHEEIPLREHYERGIPAGLSVDAAMRHLFVANVWGDRITKVDLLPQPKATDIPLRTNTQPLLRTAEAPAQDADTAAATKRAEVGLYGTGPEDSFPYACRLDEKRQRLFVSLWAQSSVAVIDLKSNQVIAHCQTQEHPCEMRLT